ncbi:hypothetical protein PM082_022484 [Marasmius tenuissimus]|nr:hypothetical protein PM082_022484 [Marasmius tenuissimus]
MFGILKAYFNPTKLSQEVLNLRFFSGMHSQTPQILVVRLGNFLALPATRHRYGIQGIISEFSNSSPRLTRSSSRNALSARPGGSANGHNSVKSTINALGGKQDFYRFRLGIGERGGTDASDYVLAKLSSHERQFWQDEGVNLVLEEIEKVLKKLAGG